MTLRLPASCEERSIREHTLEDVSLKDTDLVGALGGVLGDDHQTTFGISGDMDSLGVGQAGKLLRVNVQHVSLNTVHTRKGISFEYKRCSDYDARVLGRE